jgi:hypothetical protein
MKRSLLKTDAKLVVRSKRVYASSHPNAKSDDMITESVLVAEKELGRYLEPTESVYHIDGNLLNNDPSNLMVFKTRADRIRFAKSGIAISLEDGSYISKKALYKKVCPNCGVHFETEVYSIKRCRECQIKHGVRLDKPDNMVLRALAKRYSMEDICNLYGATKFTVKRWYGEAHIPLTEEYRTEAFTNLLRFDSNDLISCIAYKDGEIHQFESIPLAIDWIKTTTETPMDYRRIYYRIISVLRGERPYAFGWCWLSYDYAGLLERTVKQMKEFSGVKSQAILQKWKDASAKIEDK